MLPTLDRDGSGRKGGRVRSEELVVRMKEEGRKRRFGRRRGQRREERGKQRAGE